MLMDWKFPDQELPPPNTRVLVMIPKCGRKPNWFPARRVITGWIDDNSMPVRGVIAWTHVISPDETAQ